MAKLYFKYGAMNSSKSANLLMTMHNYINTGKTVALFQPCINTRDGGYVKSRIGLKEKAISIESTTNLFILVKKIYTDVDVILIDESQFLSPIQIDQLATVVDKLKIDVICYGLKVNYLGELFDASAKLLVLADSIGEIKQVCACGKCKQKAIMNLKVVNGNAVYSGDSISIGDINTESEEYFIPVCRNHYYRPLIKNMKG